MNSSNAASLIQVSINSEGIALIKLNRPEKRNALSQQLIDALVSTVTRVDCDEKVRVIILTGSNPVGPFSAGADLSELRHHTTSSAHAIQYLAQVSSSLSAARKPILASVAGFALGGGFELALACDIIFCSPTAKFGLPELSVGTIPGAGGTQRLTRLVGRQRAMWLMLSGEVVSGQVMGEWGVARCVEGDVLKETMRVAKKIASWSGPVVQLAKEAVRNAEETHLDAGLKLERGLYYSSFSLSDSKEGMTAFIEKRNPIFKDQ